MAWIESLGASSSFGFLLLGFLVGVIHALEADHLAAVATLANGGKKRLVLRGAAWGLGHTVTLLVLSIAVVVFSFVLTEPGAAMLEFAVGVMLVVLGVEVVHRFRKKRLHFHVHKHDGNAPHLHVHSHETDTVDRSVHDHAHPDRLPLKAFAIGLLHGAAGSSGIIVLAVSQTGSVWVALGYVALIGIGSIFGMAALSVVVGWPILRAPQIANRLHTAVQFSIAAVAITIGAGIMLETAPLAWEAF